MGFNGAFSGGGGGSGGAPGPQGPTGPEGPQGDPGDPGATTVTGLTDRYEELAWQTFTEPAHGGLLAASPTRDIQTAIDATPVGPACQVVVGPGSYSGTTVTIPAGRNNIAIIGPTAGDFGGTVVSLSSGRALTIGNNAVRVRLVNLQIEGLTTISTTGAGIHRIERCQLEGGLTVGAISSYIYVVGCTLGSVTVDAGFTGLLLIDRCQFNAGAVFTNNTLQTRVLISDTAGLATAPSTTAFLNGRFQLASGATQFFQDGALLLKAPLTAVNGLTPAADRIAYYTSASAAAMTALSAFGRSLIDDADASAARTTLGLGTAATANTGTGSGNIPVLDGSARLPAVDGSQLTGITSTQVSGLGTAATLTAGTSANNVPQLDGSGVLPLVAYAPETWTNRWRASDGDPTSNGFSQVGTQNLTIASTTQAGVACYSLTPPVASGTAYIQAAWTAATASWEMYAKVWIPDSATGASQRLCISYSPATTASGSKRIEIGFSATACLIFGGTNLASIVTCPNFTDQWIDLLIQCYQSADGVANSWWRISVGRLVIYSGPPPGTLAGTAGAGAGTFYIGRISASADVTPFYIAELAIRTALNAAPPEYRFGASTWPL